MQLLNIFHVLLAIGMIALILVQRGAGATAGAAFGGGASGTVFGSSGAGNFLTRTTSVAAILFFVISMSMAVMASNMSKASIDQDLGVVANDSVITQMPDVISVEAPAGDLPVPAANTAEQAVESSADDMPTADQAVEETAVDDMPEGEAPKS
ncbi:MAG: preprotein translocase subunit SecG [Xanthomonadales bacterium]|nr:preprotein translocase subunit SecG [Xanthomonadales bacterium]